MESTSPWNYRLRTENNHSAGISGSFPASVSTRRLLFRKKLRVGTGTKRNSPEARVEINVCAEILIHQSENPQNCHKKCRFQIEKIVIILDKFASHSIFHGTCKINCYLDKSHLANLKLLQDESPCQSLLTLTLQFAAAREIWLCFLTLPSPDFWEAYCLISRKEPAEGQLLITQSSDEKRWGRDLCESTEKWIRKLISYLSCMWTIATISFSAKMTLLVSFFLSWKCNGVFP